MSIKWGNTVQLLGWSVIQSKSSVNGRGDGDNDREGERKERGEIGECSGDGN